MLFRSALLTNLEFTLRPLCFDPLLDAVEHVHLEGTCEAVPREVLQRRLGDETVDRKRVVEGESVELGVRRTVIKESFTNYITPAPHSTCLSPPF